MAGEDDWFVQADYEHLLKRMLGEPLHEIEVETIKDYMKEGH